ncbi:MAG: VPLPA-CTERM sorting domain-containing protein [Pseudomonadota bacterium]
MSKSLLVAAMAASILASGPEAEAATLDGETVRIDFARPDASSVLLSSGDVVVGAGVEFNITTVYNVDVFGTFFVVSLQVPSLGFSIRPAPFNGFILSDALGAFGPFDSAVLTTTSLSDGTPSVSFDSENIFLNIAGSRFTPPTGSRLTEIARVDFTLAGPAVVPLPAGGILLLAGLGAFAGLRRRRKA